MRRIFGLCFILIAVGAGVQAEIINVPGDFDTIQEAIESTEAGDTVQVAEGQYEENIDFGGQNITVRGNPDNPAATVIDGSRGNDCVVKFINDERDSAIIEGFTLQNGEARGNGGGGIYCNGSHPQIRNVIITGCTGNRGGGILCWDSNAEITDVIITGNVANNYGGGICMVETASPVLRDVMIYGNRANSDEGGGVASRSRGRPEIYTSIIRNNSARQDGGGVFSSGNMILTAVTIDSNETEGFGGGIFSNGNITVTTSTVAANVATEGGGGIYVNGVGPNFDRVAVVNNRTGGNGGGLYVSGDVADRGCNPFIVKMTNAHNHADGNGGGIYCNDNGNPELNTGIIWGNEPEEVYFNSEEDGNSFSAVYSDIQGGEDGIVTNNNGDVDWGPGNIDADPLFEDPEASDMHLTWANFPEDDETKSPCIDTGHLNMDDDPDGSRADMGAFYYHQSYPIIDVVPEQYNFGALAVDQSDTAFFVISNEGDIQLHVESLRLIPEGDPYNITLGAGEQWIDPEASHLVCVAFAPRREGFFQTILRISSNDPIQGEINVPITGAGGNSGPAIVSPIPDFEVFEDTDWVFVADLDTVFIDPDGDRINYQIPRWRAEIQIEIRRGSELYFLPLPDFWEEDILATARAIDEGGSITTDSFMVTIHPLNDLPGPFSLMQPLNGTTLGSWETSFRWRAALQNRWETDEVVYTLHFTHDDDEYEITDIDSIIYPALTMDELADEFGIILGEREFSITWLVRAVDDSGYTECVDPFTFIIPTSSSPYDERGTIPERYFLSQNYPNPFNPLTVVRFGLPVSGEVELVVIDQQGRTVTKLLEGHYLPGYHEVEWNASGYRSGIFFICLRTSSFQTARKAVLIR